MSAIDLGVESLGVNEALDSLSAAVAAAAAAGNATSTNVASSELSSTSSPQYQQTFTAESSRCTTPLSDAGVSDDDHESNTGSQWKMGSFPHPVVQNDDDDDDEEEDEDIDDDDHPSSGAHSRSNHHHLSQHLLSSQRDDSKLTPETFALLKSEVLESHLQSMPASQSRSSSTDTASLLTLQKQMLLEQMANFQAKQKELKEKNRKAKLAHASSTTSSGPTSTSMAMPLLGSFGSKRSAHSNIVVPQVPDSQKHEFQQLLLEYRQVLLDVLAKSFKSSETEVDPATGMRLPLKCQCGFNSKISNQVTRTANYVHQLELKFRSLVEPSREKELKYTPKRPPFISGDSYPPFGQMVNDTKTSSASLNQTRETPTSMLNKTHKFKLAPTLADLGQLNKQQQQALMAQFFAQSSGESASITSSLNGDDDGIDSGEEELINGDANDGAEMLDEMNNVIPSTKAPKTILEDYLEKTMSLKNVSQPEEDEDVPAVTQTSQQSFLAQPEPIVQTTKFNTEMKKMIVQMHKQGLHVGTIAKALNASKKVIRKVIVQDAQKTDKHNQSASLLASIINGNHNPISVKRKISSIDDEEMLGEGSNAEKSDDEGSNDERESLLQSMNTNKFPLSFASQQQSQSGGGQLSNGKGVSLSNILPANVFNNFDKSMLAAQLNRSLLNNPAMMQQVKQSMKKLEQHNVANIKANLDLLGQRLSKTKSIVPGVQRNSMDWNQYSPQQQTQQQSNKNLGNASNNSAIGISHTPQIFKKDKKLRLSEPSTIKLDSGLIEADKNNNTTLNNCNASDSGSANESPPKFDPNAPLPPLPPGLIGDEDQETVLVPREFHDGVLPAQMMNSLNPNRATKLTLEDFNVVWQLRSQHWTHNQIRKYFEQRGKSISKSSISRIMNGKQRNFQAFFSVVPTKNDS